jgi:hypothetical protein
MPEKRRFKRRHLIYYLDVFDTETGQRVGQLVDITTKGIMLTSQFPIKSNIIFRLKMALPERINGHKQIVFDAKSLWCDRSVKPGFYDIGFQFLNISLKNIRIIENLIFDFSFQN